MDYRQDGSKFEFEFEVFERMSNGCHVNMSSPEEGEDVDHDPGRHREESKREP
jgi:hypothetical protein